MKYVVFALGAVFALILSMSAALAGAVCPTGYDTAACTAWKQAQARAPFNGTVAKTDEPVSCAIMVQKEPSALTVYEGSYARRASARVITTFRDTDWVQSGKVWKKVICIPKSQMAKIRSFTVCGSIGHYFFDSEETGYFKRQHGRLGSDDIARMWQGG